MVFGLDYYAEYIRLKIDEEIQFFKETKDNWDWYDIPGSLFGFDIFPRTYYSYRFKKCPLNKQQQENLTSRIFSDIVKANFDVVYNANGFVLTNKNLRTPALSTILNN